MLRLAAIFESIEKYKNDENVDVHFVSVKDFVNKIDVVSRM